MPDAELVGEALVSYIELARVDDCPVPLLAGEVALLEPAHEGVEVEVVAELQGVAGSQPHFPFQVEDVEPPLLLEGRDQEVGVQGVGPRAELARVACLLVEGAVDGRLAAQLEDRLDVGELCKLPVCREHRERLAEWPALTGVTFTRAHGDRDETRRNQPLSQPFAAAARPPHGRQPKRSLRTVLSTVHAKPGPNGTADTP